MTETILARCECEFCQRHVWKGTQVWTTDPAPSQERYWPKIQPTKPLLNLRQVRLSRNFSQESLSLRSLVTVQTISAVENGRRAPTLGTAQKLADALGVSVKELEGEEIESGLSPDSMLEGDA